MFFYYYFLPICLSLLIGNDDIDDDEDVVANVKVTFLSFPNFIDGSRRRERKKKIEFFYSCFSGQSNYVGSNSSDSDGNVEEDMAWIHSFQVQAHNWHSHDNDVRAPPTHESRISFCFIHLIFFYIPFRIPCESFDWQKHTFAVRNLHIDPLIRDTHTRAVTISEYNGVFSLPLVGKLNIIVSCCHNMWTYLFS